MGPTFGQEAENSGACTLHTFCRLCAQHQHLYIPLVYNDILDAVALAPFVFGNLSNLS